MLTPPIAGARSRRGVFAMLAAAAVFIPSASAQILVAEAEDANKNARGFALPGQAKPILEALEDFSRFTKRGEWEKAFSLLAKPELRDDTKLAPRPDGVSIPTSEMVRELLMALPVEGREAFRLLRDAEARKLLAEADESNEIERLTRVVNDYFPSSSAPTAGDRLGDLYFESGEPLRAASVWRAFADVGADADRPRIRWLTKEALALLRAGHRAAFQKVLDEIKQKHVGERVRLGGREVDPIELLASLSAAPSSATPTPTTLPETLTLAWQCRYFTSGALAELEEHQPDWWDPSRLYNIQFTPAADADAKRVYVNLLGVVFAIDLTTGKMAWRTEKFHDLPLKLRNAYRVPVDLYWIAARDGRVWVLRRPLSALNNQGEALTLARLDEATGKETWTAKNVEAIKTFTIIGRPLLTATHIYLPYTRPEKPNDLEIARWRVDGDQLEWTARVGSFPMNPMQWMTSGRPVPELTLVDGHVLVETHAGAAAAFDDATGRYLWAVSYNAEMPNQQYYYGMPTVELFTARPPLARDGMAYFKGTRGRELIALRLADRSLVWRRPIDRAGHVIAVDSSAIWLGGDVIARIDAGTRKMTWALGAPRAPGGGSPVMVGNRIVQFSPRGIYEIERANGKVARIARGADPDSNGGDILWAGDRMITVSNRAITAYQMKAPGAGAQASAESSPKAVRGKGTP